MDQEESYQFCEYDGGAGRKGWPSVTDKIDWNDILTYSKTVTDNEHVAKNWIKGYLGYMPLPHIYMPYISFIHTVIKNNEAGLISDLELSKEIVFYMETIRNDDMLKGGWISAPVYKPSSYWLYENHLAQHKDAARKRLCEFMGYEPELEHSLGAELYLRQLFDMRHYYPGMPYEEMDYKAATIANYRGMYFTYGKADADKSLLVGLHCSYSHIKNNPSD